MQNFKKISFILFQNLFVNYAVNIFDLIALSDLIVSDEPETCGYEISDMNTDGNINLLDIYTLIALIMQS